MDPKRIISIGTSSNPELVYRYTLSPDVPKYSTGLFTALMDELSTDACFRVGQPSAPGLTLQFQTELVNPTAVMNFFRNHAHNHDRHQEVDIINSVSKLGKTIAHTRTEFRCSETATLLAYASQVKYMPTGMFWLDTLLRHPTLHDWFIDAVFRVRTIHQYEQKPLVEVISQSLRSYPTHAMSGEGMPVTLPNDKEANQGTKYPPPTPLLCATFTATTEHTNPFGALHGGCHAMVMEQVALDFARTHLSSPSSSVTATTSDDNPVMMIVEAMQLEFFSPGIQGPIDVYCEMIGNDESSSTSTTSGSEHPRRILHVRVQLRTRKNNRLSSEGKLRLSAFEV